MVLIFIEGSDSLAIYNEALEWHLGAAINTVDGFVPDPESLRARINRRSHSKPFIFLLLEQNPIEQEGLARPILASHCNYSNVVIFET